MLEKSLRQAQTDIWIVNCNLAPECHTELFEVN
jgi:hypothetical protein